MRSSRGGDGSGAPNSEHEKKTNETIERAKNEIDNIKSRVTLLDFGPQKTRCELYDFIIWASKCVCVWVCVRLVEYRACYPSCSIYNIILCCITQSCLFGEATSLLRLHMYELMRYTVAVQVAGCSLPGGCARAKLAKSQTNNHFPCVVYLLDLLCDAIGMQTNFVQVRFSMCLWAECELMYHDWIRLNIWMRVACGLRLSEWNRSKLKWNPNLIAAAGATAFDTYSILQRRNLLRAKWQFHKFIDSFQIDTHFALFISLSRALSSRTVCVGLARDPWRDFIFHLKQKILNSDIKQWQFAFFSFFRSRFHVALCLSRCLSLEFNFRWMRHFAGDKSQRMRVKMKRRRKEEENSFEGHS